MTPSPADRRRPRRRARTGGTSPACGSMFSSGVDVQRRHQGAPPAPTAQRLIVDSLGSSESGGLAMLTAAGDEAADGGVPRRPDDARVVDDDGRDVVPGSGQRGRLAVGGHIPLGYYGDPDKTADDVPRPSTARATSSPATGPRSMPTARSAARAGFGVHQHRRREGVPGGGRGGAQGPTRRPRRRGRRRARRPVRRAGRRRRRAVAATTSTSRRCWRRPRAASRRLQGAPRTCPGPRSVGRRTARPTTGGFGTSPSTASPA